MNDARREKTRFHAEELRSRVIEQLTGYEELLRSADMDVQADEIHEKIAEYMQGVFSVMFTGAFSSGKSTTLNALMRQDLLRASISPETPVITKITNGEDSDNAVIKYRDPERKEESIPLADFADKYRLEFQNEGKFVEVSYVQLTRKLRTATVVFVDSPGLGNNTTDDKAANDFAKKADAIVFMMHANEAMDDKARSYMERNFRCRHLKNVFIVVNWYNTVQEQDEQRFHAKLKHDLSDIFTDENDNFDEELYNKRVFCVDSFTSFCARTGTDKKVRKGVQWVTVPVNPEEDQYTGIPEFENALYEFLEADDRDVQGYAGFLPKMAGMFSATCNHVSEVVEQSKMSLDELQCKKDSQEGDIGEILRYLDDMNQAVESTVNEIMVNIQSAYQSFSTSAFNNWDDYFSGRSVDFGLKDEFKIFGTKLKNKFMDFFGSDEVDEMARDEEFQKLLAPISAQVEEYIQQEVGKMSDKVQVNCEPVIQRLATRLQADVESIREVDLDGFDFDRLIQDVVGAGKKGTKKTMDQMGRFAGGSGEAISGDISIAQALISGVFLGNIDDMIADSMGGKKSWGEFIKGSLMKEVSDVILVVVISSIFPPAWIYYAVRAIWGVLTMSKKAGDMGTKILLGMKDATRQSIDDAREEVAIKIEEAFEKELTYGCNELISKIQLSLRQKQKQLELLIEEIKSGQFDAQQRAEELNAIEDNMMKHFNSFMALLGEREYSKEEIMDFAVEQ